MASVNQSWLKTFHCLTVTNVTTIKSRDTEMRLRLLPSWMMTNSPSSHVSGQLNLSIAHPTPAAPHPTTTNPKSYFSFFALHFHPVPTSVNFFFFYFSFFFAFNLQNSLPHICSTTTNPPTSLHPTQIRHRIYTQNTEKKMCRSPTPPTRLQLIPLPLTCF